MKRLKDIRFFLIGVIVITLVCSNQSSVKDAVEIHKEVLTIDTHCDTPFQLTREGYDISERHDPRKGGGKVDLPRMIEGGLDAQFFAVFIGQGPLTSEGYQKAQERTDRIFEEIHKMCKEHSDLAELALTPKDVPKITA